MVGFDQWDLASTAVFTTYRPNCTEEGMVSQVRVDLQSNNSYFNGFCLHSNGTMELNHGHDEVNTGFTHFNLQDIDSFAYQGQDTRESNLVLYGVRISCNSNGPCILKTSFCTGAVTEVKGQFSEDTLLFRSASHAERMTKALSHFLTLVRAQQQNQPF